MRKRITQALTARRIILALLAVLALLVATHGGEIYRRVYFQCTGTVRIDGLVFHLNPEDRVITEMMLDSGVWEPTETSALCSQLRPGDTFIDAGANIGYYTVVASKIVGDRGRVVAFEPDPASFALLKRNVEANDCRNVVLEQKALSNAPGTLKLFLAEKNKGGHSLFATADLGREPPSVEVEAVRLDDYLAGKEGRVDVVKIDTEGAEGIILEGMQETLRKNPDARLVVEFYPRKLDEAGYGAAHLLTLLAADHFQAQAIDEAEGKIFPVELARVREQPFLQRTGMTNLLLCRADGR